MPTTPDLSDLFGGHTPSTPNTSAPDLSDLFGGSSSRASVPVAASPSPSGADLSDLFGGPKPTSSAESSAPKFDYQDPNKGWIERGWSWLNTPLSESLFGLPEDRPGANGLERGVEHIASGFTSPLSLALTAATFGSGGLIESSGMTALKEAGLSATEIADAVKGSQAALGALKEAKSVEPAIQQALEAGGHDIGLLDRARKLVSPLNRDAEFGTPAIQNALKESGKFSPEELEALGKAGDTVAEAKAGFHPVEDAVRETGADVDVWKRAQKALYDNGLTEQDLLSKNMLENGAFQVLRHTIPDLPVASTARMAKTANAVLNAGFTLQQFETAAAMSPRFLDALKEGDTDKAWEYGTEAFAGGALGILGTPHALHAAGELFKPLLETDKFRPNDEFLAMDRANKEREVQHAVGEQESINLDNRVRKILGHETPGFMEKVFGPNADVKAQKALELASVFHQVVTGGDRAKAAQWYNALAEADGKEDRIENPDKAGNTGVLAESTRESGGTEGENKTSPNNGLPDNLPQLIADNNFKALPDSYKATVLDSLKRVANGELSDRELEVAKALRDEQARNLQIGSSNDLLHSFVQDYMTRTYKDLNPLGKVIASEAKQGKFATNVTMARQRVYDSHLTALLKSPKPIDFDPVSVTAKGRGELIKAAANKQLIDTLRDSFTRGSDGRPAVVLSGQGQVVSGQNGEDPKTFIDPNRVRKINIADSVVQQLDKSGDLQRFLDEGTIQDLTPCVRPSNIQAAIEKLEEQAARKEAQYDEVGNNKLSTDIMYLKAMAANKDFSGLKEFNDAQKKVYAWSPQDYVNLNNSALKGWNFVTNDSAGHNILVRSEILAHPEFAEYLKNRLGLDEGVKNPVGKALLGVGTKLKETLLSLSPFHLVQLALRGVLTGVNPFTLHGPDIIDGAKIDPTDPNSPTKIRKMVENGFTTGTDYRGQQEFSEGVSSSGEHSLMRKVPVVGPILANAMQYQTDFIFKRFLPAIKATAAEKLFDDYRAKYPDWSVDRVAKSAALHSNESFGGINWRAMGRAASSQNAARAVLLAPDWLESELRSGARLFNKDEGAIGRRQVAIMAGSMWAIARILNTVTTGNAHYEAPFSLATKSKDGKETLWSIRVLPTDLLHAAGSPVDFVKGRLSPTIHLGQEVLSGRDNFGRKLAPEDLWADAFRQMMPIPVQSIGQAVSGTGPEVGNAGQVWKAIGGTARTYQTPAQKLAAELAANHNEDGVVDPSQQQRHRLVMDMEDRVRTGDMTYPDLMKLTYETDQLKESELKKIQQNLSKTKGMDSSMASLYTRASRLPAAEYLKLLDQANISEKAALVPLTLQVQRKYLTKAKKDMTPEERMKDPVFQTLLRLVPQQTPSQ